LLKLDPESRARHIATRVIKDAKPEEAEIIRYWSADWAFFADQLHEINFEKEVL